MEILKWRLKKSKQHGKYETITSYRKRRKNIWKSDNIQENKKEMPHREKKSQSLTLGYWKNAPDFLSRIFTRDSWRPSPLRDASENIMRPRIQSATAFGIQQGDYQYIFFTWKCSDTIRNSEEDKMGNYILKKNGNIVHDTDKCLLAFIHFCFMGFRHLLHEEMRE